MQFTKFPLAFVCAFSAMTSLVTAAPLIKTQPSGTATAAGSSVTFAVAVQAEDLPAVSSGTLKLWLRADAGLTLAGTNRISQWQDQSGGNRHAFQSDTNKQPTLITNAVNGLPVVHFDGLQTTNTGDYLQGSDDLSLTNGLTAFMIYSKVNRGSLIEEVPAVAGVPGNTNAIRGFYFRGAEMAFTGWGNDTLSGYNLPSSSYRLCAERLNGTKTQVDFFDTSATNDFTVSKPAGGLTAPDAGFYVGGLGPNTRNFQGNIAEVLFYQDSLNESDRQQVANYLRQKYFPAKGTNTPGITYQWQLNGTNIPSATNAFLTLTNVQSSDNGIYTVTVGNSTNSVVSSNAVLSVLAPVAITQQPQSQSVVSGTNVQFGVAATGDGPLFYRWKFNGTNLAGETNSTLSLTNVQLGHAGTYSVLVSNSVSSVTSSNALLSVNQLPIITSQPQGATVPTGTNFTLSVAIQGALPTVTSGSLKLWLKADAGVTLQGNRVTQWADQSGGNHHALQSDTNKQPTFVSNVLNGQPVLRFDGIQSTITGDYLQGADDLSLTNGLTSFLVFYKVNRGGLYEEVPGFVGIPGNYNAARAFYFRGNEMAFSGWGNDYLSGFFIPTYTYRICTERLNASKTQVDFFDTNGTNDYSTSMVAANLIAPGAGYYVGGLGSQTRNFQGDIAELIYYQGSLTETDRQSIAAYLQQKYFQSGVANLGVTYQWQLDGVNITNATNASLTLTDIQSTNAGTYTVVISNAVGTVTSSNAVVAVVTPVSITSHPQNAAVGVGTNASFSVSATGTAPLFYQWKFNGINIAGETNSVLSLNSVLSTNAGYYSVNVSNAINSVTSSNATLTVLSAPVITAQPQNASTIAGSDVIFSVGVQGNLPNISSGALKLWLRADAGVILQGNRVTQWQDQSGEGHHAIQGNTNMQPVWVSNVLNGQAALHFDGIPSASTGDYLQGADDLTLTNGLTSFMVFSKVYRGNYEEVPGFVGVPGNYNAARAFYFRFEQEAFSGWGNDYFSGFSAPANTTRIWTERLNEAKTQVDFFDTDGTTNFSSSKVTGNLIAPGAGYYIGGLGAETRNFEGYIAEVIYYKGSLNETDRQLVSNYLKQKYIDGSSTVIGISYQWQFNGTNILNATNAILTLTNSQPVNAGLYSVIVSNAVGVTISSNALLTVNIPPSISTQPQSQSVNAGSTATFSVTASGTAPLSYQWQKDFSDVAFATNASILLTNLQPSDAAAYRVIVSSPFGTVISSNANLTVNVSTILASNVNASAAGTVVIPIQLIALGNENALGFSLSFDPAIFTFASAAFGSGTSQATLISNTNQLAGGRLGLAIGLSANNTFAAGTQTVALVTFKVAPVTNVQTSSIVFSDVPTVRQVSDVTAHGLWAAYTNGSVNISPSDFEGDVSPRPNGDRALTITDWVQVGRFVAGLDTISSGSEFQRVDCAPRNNGGNGSISVTDWVQAGRYATGADPLTPASGSTGGLARASKPSPLSFDPNRFVQIQNTQNGKTNVISVQLVAAGDENALGFSLYYDTTALSFVDADLGNSAVGAFLNVNTNEISAGKLGFALALSTGSNFAAGTQQVVKLTFVSAPYGSGTTTLNFTDSPVLREISDGTANSLNAVYSNANLTLIQAKPTLSISNSVTGITLSWPVAATGFALESGSSLTNWLGVTNNLSTNNEIISATLPFSEQSTLYRLKK